MDALSCIRVDRLTRRFTTLISVLSTVPDYLLLELTLLSQANSQLEML